MTKMMAIIGAALAATAAMAIATLPAGAHHQSGGLKQTAIAALTTPAAVVVDPQLCIGEECKSITGVPVDARRIELSLDYVLASSAHLANVVSRAGDKLYTCDSAAAPNGWGVQLAVTGSDLQRNSEIVVKLNGTEVARIPATAPPQESAPGTPSISLRLFCSA